MVCFNLGSWLPVSIIPPGKDRCLATPISLGLSWRLTNRYLFSGGDRHLLTAN